MSRKILQEELLQLLQTSGRSLWTIRMLIDLRSKRLLPALRRCVKENTNHPIFFYAEEDIQQIFDAYDSWVLCEGKKENMTLCLWLKDYNVPMIQSLRKVYSQVFENWLERLKYLDDEEREVIDKVVLKFSRRIRFNPRPINNSKRAKRETIERGTQLFFEVIAPDPNDVIELQEGFGNEVGLPEDLLSILKNVFALPNLLEAVKKSSDEEWRQARSNYLSLCSLIGEVKRSRDSKCASSYMLPDWFVNNINIQGACLLIPIFLSARFQGYGDWIDQTLKMFQMWIDSIDVDFLEGLKLNQGEQ